jgi:hypothetical protein
MALINNFKANTYLNAFILNSIVAAIIAAFAIEFRMILDENKNPISIYLYNIVGNDISEIERFLITTIVTLLAAFICYQIMYFLLGYGGGFITTNRKVKYF